MGPKRLDYSSQKEWLDAWKKGDLQKRVGNVPTWAMQEGTNKPLMTGFEYDKKVSDATKGEADRRAYLDAEEKMFPREEADFSGYDIAQDRLSRAQAGLSDILGYGRREAERVGTEAAADAAQRGYGGLALGHTPGADATRQSALDRSSSQYAQQMMNVYGKQAELDVGRTTAEENARRFGIGQDRADTARYDQLEQLAEQKRRWEEEQKLKRLGTTTNVTGTDRFGRPTGGRTTTSGFTNLGGKYSNLDYSNLLGRMG